MTAPKKIVLAYSGGLDTSVILPWLKGRYPGVKLVAFAAELGQGDELKDIEKKAYKSGADEVVVKDLRKEFAEDYCFPMLRAHATYEADYLLGTSIARPLIAKHQVLVAHQTGADAVGHGATGKGNDQVRFELTSMALDPTLAIVSPWKDPQFLADGLNDRETAIDYAQKHHIPITASKKKIYSQDRNLWHISHEGAEIEDPAEEPKEAVYTISVPPAQAPNKAEYVEVEFKAGTPVAVNGESYRGRGHELIAELNQIGGRHGVGQVTLVENRLVGMKTRGVYETPGGTILYEAHKALEQLCLERDLYHYKQQAALKYGELVYYGQWFHPLREALQTFMDHANQVVTGTVKVKLYKGRAAATSAKSPHSLYDTKLASFAMKDYDVTAARGFIDLFGLPMKVRGLRQGGGDGAPVAVDREEGAARPSAVVRGDACRSIAVTRTTRAPATTGRPEPELLRTRGLFIAEGRLVVQRLLGSTRFRTRSVLVNAAGLASLRARPPRPIDPLESSSPRREIGAIGGFNFHRGCLALGERPPARPSRRLSRPRRRASAWSSFEGWRRPTTSAVSFATRRPSARPASSSTHARSAVSQGAADGDGRRPDDAVGAPRAVARGAELPARCRRGRRGTDAAPVGAAARRLRRGTGGPRPLRSWSAPRAAGSATPHSPPRTSTSGLR